MILSADLHLRRTPPRARVDDYFAAQERKTRFILEQAQASPPLLVAGDFFHQPRPGEALLRWIIDLLNEYGVKPIVVPGQHDLPGHSLEQIGDSGLGVLAAAGVIDIVPNQDTGKGPFYSTPPYIDGLISVQSSGPDYVIFGCAYGQTPSKAIKDKNFINILLWHHMVIQEPLWPGQEAERAPAILRKYPQFDIICVGDNHQSFALSEVNQISHPSIKPITVSGRFLINPGSTMRMTAAQVNHRPFVYRFQAEEGGSILEPIPIPIETDVLDLSELEAARDKDGRIQAFVDKMKSYFDELEAELTPEQRRQIALSGGGVGRRGPTFEQGLEQYFKKNETSKEVQELVWRCLE